MSSKLYVLMFRQWLFKHFSMHPLKCMDASVMLFLYNLDVCFTLGKKNFKFSIEYSIGFLLIVFYRIFANSFL